MLSEKQIISLRDKYIKSLNLVHLKYGGVGANVHIAFLECHINLLNTILEQEEK